MGSPETVRGKTFLCTTMSSPHMALSSWLKVLGLTDKDVVIKNMDQPRLWARLKTAPATAWPSGRRTSM